MQFCFGFEHASGCFMAANIWASERELLCYIGPQFSLYLYISFGAMSLGAVSMHLNWQQPPETTYHLLQKHSVQLLCTCDCFEARPPPSDNPRKDSTPYTHLFIDDLAHHELTQSAKADIMLQLSHQANTTAVVFFTSGTTGVPKAVPHTNLGLVWHADKTKRLLLKHIHAPPRGGTVCFTPSFT